MSEMPQKPELLPSLGCLVRGLSLLFWGLPVALVVCVQTAQSDYLRVFGIVPPVLVTAFPVYGLTLLTRFHKEETIWITALERARALAVINLGLSPFLFWWSKMPANTFYTVMMQAMALSGVLFMLALNPMLRRLTAMLPDEALRHETIVFTQINTVLLAIDAFLVVVSCVRYHLKTSLPVPISWQLFLERTGHWGIWFFVLLTVATTMALIWKTKEVIFHSVFGNAD